MQRRLVFKATQELLKEFNLDLPILRGRQLWDMAENLAAKFLLKAYHEVEDLHIRVEVDCQSSFEPLVFSPISLKMKGYDLKGK